MDKYKKKVEEATQSIDKSTVQLEGDTNTAGKDNVNVAGGYEHLGKDKKPDPQNQTLAQSKAKAQVKAMQENSPEFKDGLSNVTTNENDVER